MRRILCVSMGLLLLLGCSSKRNRSVSGTLSYKGQPVGNVVLRFTPPSGGAEIPIPVGSDGKFNTTGIAPGEYKIVIQGGPPPGRAPGMPNASTKGMDPAKVEEMQQKLAQMPGQKEATTVNFPAKYRQVHSTDLTCKINDTGNQVLNLELTD